MWVDDGSDINDSDSDADGGGGDVDDDDCDDEVIDDDVVLMCVQVPNVCGSAQDLQEGDGPQRIH